MATYCLIIAWVIIEENQKEIFFNNIGLTCNFAEAFSRMRKEILC